VPIPAALTSTKTLRRVTVTLSWFSPVKPLHQKYREAALFFDVNAPEAFWKSRQEADNKAVMRGTLQHEIFAGDAAIPISDTDELTVRVNCRADAAPSLRKPVRYALAVSLEIAENLNVKLYEQVRERLRERVPVGV
jgi:hypothetical protein